MMRWAILVALLVSLVHASSYSLVVESFNPRPIFSFLEKTSAFEATFNPSWVEASSGQPKTGILARLQNCTLTSTSCAHCGGIKAPSYISFSEKDSSGHFADITNASVVFSPDGSSAESYGTEDPRIHLDPSTGIYYMYYTAYGPNNVLLNLATTKNPTVKGGWTRHGPVFPDKQNSKSAALLIMPSPPHYLYWGAGTIALATSKDLLTWTTINSSFIDHRKGHFDDVLVESGPPPLKLSDGNYLFIYNSMNSTGSYQTGFVIINGTNPTHILHRSDAPFLTPTFAAWMRGVAPWTCNVENVIFLEAAVQVKPNVFDVYFGGADAVIGTARIVINIS